MDAGRNHFNVLVDGRASGSFEGSVGVRDYWLQLRAAASGPVVVELQKCTEARISSSLGALLRRHTRPVELHGLLLRDGSLADAPAFPDRRIEFIGDSETSGFGNLGPSQPGTPGLRMLLTVDPAHQDSLQAWPAVVANALQADASIIAWSGMGVLWNCGCSTRLTMRDVYGHVLASEADGASGPSADAAAEGRGLDAWVPDVVVLYIGGNDWYSFRPEREGQLAEACLELLVKVRSLRPQARLLVLCASGESMCGCLGSLEEQRRFAGDLERCWRRALEAFGDGNAALEVVLPSPAIELADASDWGQMGHWSAKGNAKWASAVTPLVAKHMGWQTST